MPKQTFEEKIKAGKAKFKVIREGNFRILYSRKALGVALRQSPTGSPYQENIILKKS